MRSIGDIRALIAKHFPKMTDAQIKAASAEEMSIFVFSRLLDSLCQNIEAFVAAAVTGNIPGLGDQMIAPQAGMMPPQPQGDDNGAGWVMAGLDPNDHTAPPGQQPGAAASDADWVMQGIEEDGAGGRAPASPQAPPNGNGGNAAPQSLPNVSGAAVLPPEVIAAMSKPAGPPPTPKGK